MLRSLIILAGAMGLAACGGQQEEAGTRTIEGRGNTFEEAMADAERQLDAEYRPATPEETEEALELAWQALDDMADKRPSAEIAAAIDAFHYGAGKSGYFDTSGFPYRPAEFGQITDLPPDAAADGIGGAAGLVLDATDDGPFKSVLVSYLVFNDGADAWDYRDKLDRNFNQSLVEYETFDLTQDGTAVREVRCSYVPNANNSVNCHHMGPSDRVIAVLLFADGPYLDFSRGMRAIDLVFDNAEADFRIRDTTAQAAAYLFDAVAPAR